MHINFLLPTWVMLLGGGLAYPTIGVAVANFLLRNSRRKMHPALVFIAAALWPATFAGVIAAAPIWTAVWIATNYAGAIKRLVGGQVFSGASNDSAGFILGTSVRVMRDMTIEGRMVPNAWIGQVRDQQGANYKVDFGPSYGTFWVHGDALLRA